MEAPTTDYLLSFQGFSAHLAEQCVRVNLLSQTPHPGEEEWDHDGRRVGGEQHQIVMGCWGLHVGD